MTTLLHGGPWLKMKETFFHSYFCMKVTEHLMFIIQPGKFDSGYTTTSAGCQKPNFFTVHTTLKNLCNTVLPKTTK